MADNSDPVLCPVPIRSLRPTQLTVGLIEVEEKRKEWRSKKKKGQFLGHHMIPVVTGPKNELYVIDHHHLARALLDEGQDEILVQEIANLSSLSKESFWRFLDYRAWVHPFDEKGERRPFSAIPKKIIHLEDDPFRSLAGAVRRAGGYAKEAQPFMEFVWADFFRRAFKVDDIHKHWAGTLKEAVELAHNRKAHFMPGWCGPN